MTTPRILEVPVPEGLEFSHQGAMDTSYTLFFQAPAFKDYKPCAKIEELFMGCLLDMQKRTEEIELRRQESAMRMISSLDRPTLAGSSTPEMTDAPSTDAAPMPTESTEEPQVEADEIRSVLATGGRLEKAMDLVTPVLVNTGYVENEAGTKIPLIKNHLDKLTADTFMRAGLEYLAFFIIKSAA